MPMVGRGKRKAMAILSRVVATFLRAVDSLDRYEGVAGWRP